MSSAEPARAKAARAKGAARTSKASPVKAAGVAAPAKKAARVTAPAKKTARAEAPAKTKAPAKSAKPTAKPAPQASADGVSGEAQRLAALLDQALERGELETISREALQALLAALCKNYSARVEAGEDFLPLSQRGRCTPTDVMVTASKLLRSANLQVFELGMWQSWTGR
jgi:hypothetical protein